jgi:TonB family protein
LSAAAAAAAQPVDPRPANSPSSWMSISDYPADALAKHQEGTVGFALAIDASGQVQSCSVTESSGSSALDQGTCALLKSRAKFEPARDASGHAVAGTFASKIQWVYPQPAQAAAAAAALAPVELHGFDRVGYGSSVLSVDENGIITKCEHGDSGYANIPSPPDFCWMFPVGSRYGPPALYKGKPMKRRITMKLDIKDENVP